ncbi:SDR family NAD(P)-dependent oxidoreductase [Brevibacterium jeotgali]|uniref:SDR family NAD(P)-dependent oxidoreductase n=1 Tax=Brevibacterium jeotgali TaxID=1262550 RepID=UPI0027E31746|nr:SDR family NAD(P)-dependent oxidoreductase [Brevibacterium jeotgali]
MTDLLRDRRALVTGAASGAGRAAALAFAAKHGLMGLTKTTALEGGPRGVTCDAINPGCVMTPPVESRAADQAKTRGISEDAVHIASGPVGRSTAPGTRSTGAGPRNER